MRYLLVGVLVVAVTGCRPNAAGKPEAAGKDSPATGEPTKEKHAEPAAEQTGELTKEECAYLQATCEEGISTTYEGRRVWPVPSPRGRAEDSG